jgi:hypothetical protein
VVESPTVEAQSETTETVAGLVPTATSSEPGPVLSVEFDFPELGLRGSVPEDYELLLEPRLRPAPIDGVSFAHANWGNKKLGSVIVVSSAVGLERDSEFSPERRAGVTQIAVRSDDEPVYRFVDPGGSVEVFWRLANDTIVAVVGTNVHDETVLLAVADAIRSTGGEQEVGS